MCVCVRARACDIPGTASGKPGETLAVSMDCEFEIPSVRPSPTSSILYFYLDVETSVDSVPNVYLVAALDTEITLYSHTRTHSTCILTLSLNLDSLFRLY